MLAGECDAQRLTRDYIHSGELGTGMAFSMSQNKMAAVMRVNKPGRETRGIPIAESQSETQMAKAGSTSDEPTASRIGMHRLR